MYNTLQNSFLEVSTLWVDSFTRRKTHGSEHVDSQVDLALRNLVESTHPILALTHCHFLRIISPRVWTGRHTGRPNSGKSCLSRLTRSSRRLIPYFSLNQFVVGPNRSTRRSTQPWRMLCLSRFLPSLSRLNLFLIARQYCKLLKYY